MVNPSNSYLVSIEVTNETLLDGQHTYTMHRLVVANDKNNAWDKTDKYMREIYVTRSDTVYQITVHETIL